MKDTKNMTNQRGAKPGDNPRREIGPPDEDPNPERRDPEPGDPPGGPNPDSRPNEIRASDRDYRYRGGRQGVGEVPNPREVREDAANHRETADQDVSDRDESVQSDGQNRTKRLNNETPNPE